NGNKIGSGNINTGNIASGNTVNNNTISGPTNNIVSNRQNWGGNVVGGGYGGYGYPGYYPGAYGNWHSGSWSNWNSYPAIWAGTSAVAGWLGAAAAPSYSYANPFAVDLGATSFQSSYSYTDPIPAYVEPQSNPTVVVNATQTGTFVNDQQAPAAPPAV